MPFVLFDTAKAKVKNDKRRVLGPCVTFYQMFSKISQKQHSAMSDKQMDRLMDRQTDTDKL